MKGGTKVEITEKKTKEEEEMSGREGKKNEIQNFIRASTCTAQVICEYCSRFTCAKKVGLADTDPFH